MSEKQARSLPDLATVSWVKLTEEDIIKDEAEQALNEQYDKHVNDFYLDARAKAAAIRQIYEENSIQKLFESDN